MADNPRTPKSNPFASVLDTKTPTIEEYSDEESSEDELVKSRGKSGRKKAPRPSVIPQRRRRRSSCVGERLSISARKSTSNSNVIELYQKAIRMNAENKINVANSWNLPLIENMEKLVAMDADEADNNNRVNFTRASCTLDASVKIYGYRVDDVHLTSYKVLANLNRTDHKKPSVATAGEVGNNEGEFDDTEETQPPGTTSKRSKNQNGNTLETNIANINLTKLDSAFDIDPLFHKMTKTFDEGGAKGLLLVNLGVGESGCNVVFDSSETQEPQEPPTPENAAKTMDISSLVQKFQSLLDAENSELNEIPLVPQLESLRTEHYGLEEQGFCDVADLIATVGPKTPGKRLYHSSEADEALADRRIHSLAAQRGLGFTADDEDTEVDTPLANAAEDNANFVDFGGFDDDGIDDDAGEEAGVDMYIANINPRFSVEATPPKNPTTQLLDDLASGRASLSMDDYTFLSEDNQWAGPSHWKQKKPKTATKKKPKSATKKRKPKDKSSSIVSFTGPPPNMDKYLPKPKTSTRLSKAMIKKYTEQDNLLPVDTKVSIQDLSKLFLLPDLDISAPVTSTNDERHKTVAFDLNDDGDDVQDHSFGDDGDGPGFDFGGVDENVKDDSFDEGFTVQELEGVRKVEKVRVGYATVAKKVDVKQLKNELWTGLEDKLDDESEVISFQAVVREMEEQKTQADATLPFYFICALHLANEHGLRFESHGLGDFTISED